MPGRRGPRSAGRPARGRTAPAASTTGTSGRGPAASSPMTRRGRDPGRLRSPTSSRGPGNDPAHRASARSCADVPPRDERQVRGHDGERAGRSLDDCRQRDPRLVRHRRQPAAARHQQRHARAAPPRSAGPATTAPAAGTRGPRRTTVRRRPRRRPRSRRSRPPPGVPSTAGTNRHHAAPSAVGHAGGLVDAAGAVLVAVDLLQPDDVGVQRPRGRPQVLDADRAVRHDRAVQQVEGRDTHRPTLCARPATGWHPTGS